MDELRKIYQDYLDTPYYARVAQGREEVAFIKKELRKEIKNAKDGMLNLFIVSICRGFIGADDFFDDYEYEYLKDVFGFGVSKDQILETLNIQTPEIARTNKELIAGANRELRMAFVRLGLLICVADGHLAPSEMQEIEKFL